MTPCLLSSKLKQSNISDKQYLFVFFSASNNSDAIVPETEKLAMEGRIVQKLECRPDGNNKILFLFFILTKNSKSVSKKLGFKQLFIF